MGDTPNDIKYTAKKYDGQAEKTNNRTNNKSLIERQTLIVGPYRLVCSQRESLNWQFLVEKCLLSKGYFSQIFNQWYNKQATYFWDPSVTFYRIEVSKVRF